MILIGAILSTLLSANISVSAGILKGWFLAPMALALMAFVEIKDEKSVKRLFGALFTSSVIVAIVALIYYALGSLTFDGRLSAFYLSPNHLAMYLAPGFIIGIMLFKLSINKKEKAAILCGFIFISVALYLTYSYAAWISVLTVSAFFLYIKLVISGLTRDPDLDSRWSLSRTAIRDGNDKKEYFLLAHRKLVFVCLLLILIGGLFFLQSNSEKLNDLLYSSRSSLQSRAMIWRAALEIGKDNPIFGIGPGMFQEFYLKYQNRFAVPYLEWAVPQPHNIFLAFWLQTGILGLIGFLWLTFEFFKQLKRCQVPFKRVPDTLVLVLAGLMIYVLLHGLVDATYWKSDLAVVFWVVIAMSARLLYKTVHDNISEKI